MNLHHQKTTLINNLPLEIGGATGRIKKENGKENGFQIRPKIHYKPPSNFSNQKHPNPTEIPLEINEMRSTEKVETKTRSTEKETLESNETPKRCKKPGNNDAKQVRWKTSEKTFGNLYSLAPRSDFVLKQKSIQKFTEIPHLLDGFKMVNIHRNSLTSA